LPGVGPAELLTTFIDASTKVAFTWLQYSFKQSLQKSHQREREREGECNYCLLGILIVFFRNILK
jgi:hypothetical protein